MPSPACPSLLAGICAGKKWSVDLHDDYLRSYAADVDRRAEAFAGVQQLTAAVRRMVSGKSGNPVSFDVQPDQKWWSSDTSAIVTGGRILPAFSSLRLSCIPPSLDTDNQPCNAANKGIGWDIARILSEQGLRTVLTSRRGAQNAKHGCLCSVACQAVLSLHLIKLAAAEDAGKEAVDRIKAQAPHATVTFARLDISQPESVNAFASWAKQELGSSLRIVVNNAGEHSIAGRHTSGVSRALRAPHSQVSMIWNLKICKTRHCFQG